MSSGLKERKGQRLWRWELKSVLFICSHHCCEETQMLCLGVRRHYGCEKHQRARGVERPEISGVLPHRKAWGVHLCYFAAPLASELRLPHASTSFLCCGCPRLSGPKGQNLAGAEPGMCRTGSWRDARLSDILELEDSDSWWTCMPI